MRETQNPFGPDAARAEPGRPGEPAGPPLDPAVRMQLRSGQVIVGALAAGALGFGGVALLLVTQATGPGSPPPAMTPTPMAIAVLVTALIAGGVWAVAGRIARIVPRPPGMPATAGGVDEAMLAAQFVVRAIIRGAALEGVGLLAAVSTIITGETMFLPVTVAAAGLTLALAFPTEGRFRATLRAPDAPPAM